MTGPFKGPKPVSPMQPVALGLEDRFRFRCHKGIACFNQCCKNNDILLTPYDVVRLKNRLDLSGRHVRNNSKPSTMQWTGSFDICHSPDFGSY